MTILATIPRNQYVATNGQTVFTYTFEIFDKDDILVQQNGSTLVEGTNYTVSGVNLDVGGDITLTVGATTGDIITLSRDMAIERLTAYQNAGDFLAIEVNDDYDRIWAVLQQNDNNLSRSIRAAIDDPILNRTNTELAPPNTRASKTLGFDSAGKITYFSASIAVGDLTDVPTVAAMTALTGLTAGISVVTTKENTATNGGGAPYDVVLTTSVVPNTFNIIIGAIDPLLSFVLREENLPFLTTRMYGAVSGDITSLLAQFALSTHKNKVISSGTYDIASTVKFLTGEESITFEGAPTFNANGSYTSAIIEIGTDSTTLLATLVAQLDEGETNLPVTGLVKGDVIAVWNPVDGSWSNFRVSYRQGEICRVTDDTDGSTTEVASSLVDTYPIGTQILKLNITGSVERITGKVNFISSTKAGRLCLLITQNIDTDISGLQVTQVNSTHTLSLKRCLGVNGISVLARQTAVSVAGTDYGLVIINCQSSDIQGDFHAERHGVTVGGNDTPGSIINRYIHIKGIFSTTGLGNVAAANWHGNAESCSFGGRIMGLDLAGHRQTILKGTIIDPIPGASNVNAATVSCSELKSMEHDLSNITIRGEGDPQLSSRGVFDCGGNSNALTVDTVLSGKLNLRNTKLIAPIATAGIVIRTRGSLVPYDVDISGMTFDTPLAASGIYRNDTVSGLDQRRLFMGQITDPANSLILVNAATKVSEASESGTGGMVTTTSIATVTLAIVFTHKFPQTPNVTLGQKSIFSGAKLIIANASSITTLGFNLTLSVGDLTNFSANETLDVYWRASLNN